MVRNPKTGFLTLRLTFEELNGDNKIVLNPETEIVSCGIESLNLSVSHL